jgi:menaquinone C8-methyltransferase
MEQLIRRSLLKLLTGEREILLTKRVPSRDELSAKLEKVDALGLYLHIPFCERICPYCPYNKEVYRRDLAERYVSAVRREIDVYAAMAGGKPVTSFYIGGGTPTTTLHHGLAEMIGHVRGAFSLQCDIHMESHPNHLSAANLRAIRSMGVRHLSIGVEALADRHLRTLCRPYTVAEAKEAVRRAVAAGFACVNVDVIFALPGQTCEDIDMTGRELVALGVDQVAAYPLFLFPYTHMGRVSRSRNHGIARSLRRRRMLHILERIFYEAGYERTSVWAFTRRGVPRYCSVTVPLYVGLGASGGTYLRDVFYLNTFSAAEYVEALEAGRMPIALSIDLSERMQRAGWLYWRIYETAFSRADYRARFGEEIDRAYGTYLRLWRLLGFLKNDGQRIVLSDRGSFWLHAFEDIASIDYISTLWGAAQRDCWPGEVALQ